MGEKEEKFEKAGAVVATCPAGVRVGGASFAFYMKIDALAPQILKGKLHQKSLQSGGKVIHYICMKTQVSALSAGAGRVCPFITACL